MNTPEAVTVSQTEIALHPELIYTGIEEARIKKARKTWSRPVSYTTRDKIEQNLIPTIPVYKEPAGVIELKPPSIQEAYKDVISAMEKIFTDPQNEKDKTYIPKPGKLDEDAAQTTQEGHTLTSLSLIEDDGKKVELTVRSKRAGVDGPRDEVIRTIVLNDDRSPMHPEKRILILTTPTQSEKGIVTITEGLLYSTKLGEDMKPVTTQIPVTDSEQFKIIAQALIEHQPTVNH